MLLTKALEINSQSLDDSLRCLFVQIEFHRVLAEIPGNPIFMAIRICSAGLANRRSPESVPVVKSCMNIITSYQQHIVIVDAKL